MKSIKIAVGIPAYNCKDTLERAVNSVLSQTYTDWHIYIINDCSTDGTEITLNYFKNNNKITLVNNDFNMGVAETRNKIISLAKEDYIAFLDADDEWLPHKLECQVECILSGSHAVITNYSYVDANNEISVEYGKTKISKNDFYKKKIRVCFSSLLYFKYGTTGELYKFHKIGHEDYLFLSDIIRDRKNMSLVSNKLVRYYVVSGSLSENKARASYWHYKVLCRVFTNKFLVAYYFVHYIINAIQFRQRIMK